MIRINSIIPDWITWFILYIYIYNIIFTLFVLSTIFHTYINYKKKVVSSCIDINSGDKINYTLPSGVRGAPNRLV